MYEVNGCHVLFLGDALEMSSTACLTGAQLSNHRWSQARERDCQCPVSNSKAKLLNSMLLIMYSNAPILHFKIYWCIWEQERAFRPRSLLGCPLLPGPDRLNRMASLLCAWWEPRDQSHYHCLAESLYHEAGVGSRNVDSNPGTLMQNLNILNANPNTTPLFFFF